MKTHKKSEVSNFNELAAEEPKDIPIIIDVKPNSAHEKTPEGATSDAKKPGGTS